MENCSHQLKELRRAVIWTLSCCDGLFYLNLTVHLNRPQLTLEHLRSRLSKIAHEMIESTVSISAYTVLFIFLSPPLKSYVVK